jgi:hypothetical protein
MAHTIPFAQCIASKLPIIARRGNLRDADFATHFAPRMQL